MTESAIWSERDPFRIPDDGVNRVINFSGGRTSAYMLYRILEAHDGKLPPRTIVCFANTGKELSETLVFVHRCGENWGVPIVWLEYGYNPNAKGGRRFPRNVVKVVNLRTASYTGRPFRTLIQASSILPNVAMRKCTSELKVRTVSRYCLRHHGWNQKQFNNVLGIRHDEPHRWVTALYEHCDSEFPLVHAGVDEPEVMDFWSRQPFDLEIHGDQGNCDLCFLKGKAKLMRLIRRRPELADWWIEQEKAVLKTAGRRLRKSEMAQFSQRYTYEGLRRMALTARELPFDVPEEPSISCFCGD